MSFDFLKKQTDEANDYLDKWAMKEQIKKLEKENEFLRLWIAEVQHAVEECSAITRSMLLYGDMHANFCHGDGGKFGVAVEKANYHGLNPFVPIDDVAYRAKQFAKKHNLM